MIKKLLFLVICTTLFNSCFFIGNSGLLYLNMTKPLSTNFKNTPVGSKRAVIDLFTVKEPVSGIGMSAEWSSNVLNEAARLTGMKKVYYIDIERFSVFGVYSNTKYIVYGD